MSEPAKDPVEPVPGTSTDSLDDVPRLPRGRGLKLSGPELFRILLTLGMLVAIIILTRPCSNAVSNFVMGFDGSGSAKGSAMPRPDNVAPPRPAVDPSQYETLRPGMTDEEVKAAIERAKARAAGSGAPAGDSAGSAGAH